MIKKRAVSLGVLVFFSIGQFFSGSLLADNHEDKWEKSRQQIQAQYEHKVQRLETWTEKKMAKCNGRARCEKKVKRIYQRSKAKIEKQYDQRKKALQRKIEKEESQSQGEGE